MPHKGSNDRVDKANFLEQEHGQSSTGESGLSEKGQVARRLGELSDRGWIMYGKEVSLAKGNDLNETQRQPQ